MSCVGTEQKVLEPIKEKTKGSDEQGVKNGKPCIDFQPDDRWQIKDDDTQKKNENSISSKVKDATCSNGRRSLRSRNKNCAPLNGDANDSSSDSEAPVTNTVQAIVHTEEAEKSASQKIRSKRKRGVEVGNGQNHKESQKKIKVEKSDCDNKVDSSSDPEKESKASEIDDTSSNSDSTPFESKTSSEKERLDVDCIEVIEEAKDVSNQSSKSQEVEDVDKEKVTSSDSENSSESQAKSVKEEVGDDDIEVISDEDEVVSDSEVQILGSEETECKEETEDNRETIEFKTSSDLDVSLSSGYMYYNSLKEKIPNFKAGAYKPVKFPHTGTLLLAEKEVIIESPSLLVPLLIKETDEFPNIEGEEKKVNKQSFLHKKNFFQSSVGQFLINLGLSRVQEFYHRDMKRIVFKQIKNSKIGNTAEKEKAAAFHERRNDELKEINAVFNSRMRHCKHCDFRTESAIVLEGHYLTPHLSPRREFRCNFCDFMTRDPSGIAFHYEAMHSKKVLLDSNIPLHECIFCSFSSTLKNKVSMHMNRCRKQFIPSQNLAPAFDFEFPGVTTKPVTMADVVGHRRLIFNSAKGRGMPDDSAYTRKKLASVLSKLSGQPGYDDKSQNLMKHLISPMVPPLSSGSSIQLPPGIVITRPRGQPIQQLRPIGRGIGRFPQPRGIQSIRGPVPRRGIQYATGLPSAASHLASSGISITPVSRGSAPIRSNTMSGVKNITLTPISNASNRTVLQKPSAPQPVALFPNLSGNPRAPFGRGGLVTTLRTMPPYQRANTPPSQVVKGSSGNSFVVCEICDSYIKDLEELRTHMNFMHKVKIHPKMLVSRPPLNCQKCQWRFFTDQGLERHLLGAHGLVTTNMQEMANKNQDGGRCIICGAVFTYKLVSHMTQVHKVTLKPAHLSYKCTVCTATFTLYRLFESHVYNEHSGSAKRSAEDSSSEPPAKKVAEELSVRRCNECNVITDNMQEHLIKHHMKDCFVKLCRIEKCKKCLYSSDEMLVIRMSDFGLDDELDDSSDGSESSDSSESEEENED